MPESPGRPGITILQLLVVVVTPSVGSLAALWIWPGTTGGLVYGMCKLLLYGVPLVVLWRIRPGLGMVRLVLGNWSIRGFFAGMASGILAGALIVLSWKLWLGADTDTGRLLAVLDENGMSEPLRFWLFAAWLCIGNSLLEEVVFRWFVDTRLERLGVWWVPATMISATIFTLHHVIVLAAYFAWPLVILGSLGVFVGGAAWTVMRRHWNGILPGWISHGIVDLAIIMVAADLLLDQA